MSLRDWEENKWLVRHETSAEEVRKLLVVVERNLADSGVPGLSPDRQYVIAYEAALALATLALAVSGYRPHKGAGSHYYAIQSLAHTVGLKVDSVDFLDTARRIRNEAEYLQAGVAHQEDADQMREVAQGLWQIVTDWVRIVRKDFLP